MTDYQIAASTRRCATTGRDLKAGERYWCALVEEAGRFIRKDFALDAWSGPPEGAVGHWQARLPTGSTPRRPPVDEEMLLECFARLEGATEAASLKFRFVLGLFLLRRRRLRLDDTCREGGAEVLLMRCTRSGGRFRVVDPALTDGELESVQEDVFRVLGWQ